MVVRAGKEKAPQVPDDPEIAGMTAEERRQADIDADVPCQPCALADRRCSRDTTDNQRCLACSSKEECKFKWELEENPKSRRNQQKGGVSREHAELTANIPLLRAIEANQNKIADNETTIARLEARRATAMDAIAEVVTKFRRGIAEEYNASASEQHSKDKDTGIASHNPSKTVQIEPGALDRSLDG